MSVIDTGTLLRFCAPAGDPHDRPFHLDDFTVYTNRFLMICVPGRIEQGQAANMSEAAYKRRRGLIDAAVAACDGTWQDVTSLRCHGAKCVVCCGSGHCEVVECDDCDGDGSFVHGKHVYDCQECAGVGEIDRAGGEGTPYCNDCCGTGFADAATDFAVAGYPNNSANQVAAALLSKLPACQLRHEPIVVKGTTCTHMLAIRFQGGVGLLAEFRGQPIAPEALLAQGVLS